MERSESGATFRRHAAELDVGLHMHGVPLRQAAWMVTAAAVVGAMLNSEALASWAFDLPLWLGPVRDALLAAANAWHSAMTALGFDRIHAGLREAFRAFQYR